MLALKRATPILSTLTSLYVCAIATVLAPFAPATRPSTPVLLPGNVEVVGLYDTGAQFSLMSKESFRKIPISLRPVKDNSIPFPLWASRFLPLSPMPLLPSY